MFLKSHFDLLPSFHPYEDLQRTLSELVGSSIHPWVPWALSFLNGSIVLGFLFGRTYRLLPGHGLKLKAGIKLAPVEANPLAAQVRNLIDGGFLRATSVGFIPLEWEFARDPARPNGINFIRQRLIEFSLVNLPCNPQAKIDRAPVAIGSGKSSSPSEAQLRRKRVLADLKRGAVR